MQFIIPHFTVCILGFILVTGFSSAANLETDSTFLKCEFQWTPKRVSDADVTFIIPSKARSTLIRTFSSLHKQTRQSWLAIVVFDGILSDSLYMNKTTGVPVFMNMIPPEIIHDGRYCFQHSPASGRLSNCAGELRNVGMEFVKTEWIGFVDDDDTLRPEYIEHLLNHAKEYPSAQLVLFRMCNYFPDRDITRVIPALTVESIILNDAGISFAFRRRIFQDLHYKLIPSNAEDFLFLERLYNERMPILLSEWCTYKVRDHHHPDCEKLGKRALIQRPLESPPSHSLEWQGCSVSKPTNLNFVFTEGDSVFHRNYVKGLQASLNTTLQRRCLTGDQAYFDPPIHIIFGTNTVPISPYYIQVHVEQLNVHHYNDNYKEKLSNAVQIWEFSYNEREGVVRLPNVETDVYFVPTILMLDNSTLVYHCPSVNPAQSIKFFSKKKNIIANPFKVYRFGQYHTCSYNRQEHVWKLIKSEPSTCYAHGRPNGYCWNSSIPVKAVNSGSFCSEIVRRDVPIDVLMFGAMELSFGNQREQLCDSLMLTGNAALCVQSAFRELLNYLVCVSKIIVINHYYENSALETHRIDSLLQAKKVVVATSSPSALDGYYSRGTPVVKPEEVVPVVQKILANYDHALAHFYHTERFLQQMTTNFDPLCYAITQLGERMKSKYFKLNPHQTEGGVMRQNW
jgi:glycosyltransferase involved in cell wall biosynthesis